MLNKGSNFDETSVCFPGNQFLTDRIGLWLSLQIILSLPKNCPKDIYELMRECWHRNDVDRPSFREIHMFLQRKNLGYKHAETNDT